MKQTIQGIAIGVAGALIISLGSSAVIVEGRNQALRNHVKWQSKEILKLQVQTSYLRAVSNNCAVLEYVLPEICVSELSRISYNVVKIKEGG